MLQVDAYQVSLKATGTNEAAMALLQKAQEYASVALTNGMNWDLPGQSSIQALQLQLDQLTITVTARGNDPEDISPEWEQVRNLYWKAKQEASASDAGRAARIDNYLLLRDDIAQNAASAVKDIGDYSKYVFAGIALLGVALFIAKVK